MLLNFSDMLPLSIENFFVRGISNNMIGGSIASSLGDLEHLLTL